MGIVLNLKPETERRLAARAARQGLALPAYLEQLAERASEADAEAGETAPTFEEMTGGLARAVGAAGLSDDEVGEFFDEVVTEVRAERRAGQGPPA